MSAPSATTTSPFSLTVKFSEPSPESVYVSASPSASVAARVATTLPASVFSATELSSLIERSAGPSFKSFTVNVTSSVNVLPPSSVVVTVNVNSDVSSKSISAPSLTTRRLPSTSRISAPGPEISNVWPLSWFSSEAPSVATVTPDAEFSSMAVLSNVMSVGAGFSSMSLTSTTTRCVTDKPPLSVT